MSMNYGNTTSKISKCKSGLEGSALLIAIFSIVLLPERDYVTFGSLPLQIRLSVVSRLSVTLVHPTQEVEAFYNISSPLCTLAIL